MKTKTRIFFSGQLLANGSPLIRFCEDNNWDLKEKSLLQFEPVPFQILRPFDVVFISSIRSYNYFISGIISSDRICYAVIGQGTAGKMNLQNSSIVFIGNHSGNPESVALDFKEWLGERRVLFPLSTRSNETVARIIPENQKEVVRCYKTNLVEAVIEEADIYVFTSPSNVEAFLLKNTLSQSATLVAWGSTTRKKLVELGFDPRIVLSDSSEEALVRELKKIS